MTLQFCNARIEAEGLLTFDLVGDEGLRSLPGEAAAELASTCKGIDLILQIDLKWRVSDFRWLTAKLRGTKPVPRDQKITRRKIGLLELARQLGSVSQACKIMGDSWVGFYRLKKLQENGGELPCRNCPGASPNGRTG
jgi:hypothetical protein